jgi:hypothetical protein
MTASLASEARGSSTPAAGLRSHVSLSYTRISATQFVGTGHPVSTSSTAGKRDHIDIYLDTP